METYHELRAEGLPFSEQYQSDRPPVLDPGGGSLLDRPSSASRGASSTGGRGATASTGALSSRGGGRGGSGVGAGSPELSSLSGEGCGLACFKGGVRGGGGRGVYSYCAWP